MENLQENTDVLDDLTDTSGKYSSRELSFGQKAVGLNFNPSGIKDVDDCKRHCGDVIDRLYAIQQSSDSSHEKVLLCENAIRQMQTAQMWAVKAITWQE